MTVDRREIGDECGPHRRTLTTQRDRDISPGKAAAAEELMHQNPHGMEYIGTPL